MGVRLGARARRKRDGSSDRREPGARGARGARHVGAVSFAASAVPGADEAAGRRLGSGSCRRSAGPAPGGVPVRRRTGGVAHLRRCGNPYRMSPCDRNSHDSPHTLQTRGFVEDMPRPARCRLRPRRAPRILAQTEPDDGTGECEWRNGHIERMPAPSHSASAGALRGRDGDRQGGAPAPQGRRIAGCDGDCRPTAVGGQTTRWNREEGMVARLLLGGRRGAPGWQGVAHSVLQGFRWGCVL